MAELSKVTFVDGKLFVDGKKARSIPAPRALVFEPGCLEAIRSWLQEGFYFSKATVRATRVDGRKIIDCEFTTDEGPVAFRMVNVMSLTQTRGLDSSIAAIYAETSIYLALGIRGWETREGRTELLLKEPMVRFGGQVVL